MLLWGVIGDFRHCPPGNRALARNFFGWGEIGLFARGRAAGITIGLLMGSGLFRLGFAACFGVDWDGY